MRRAKKKEEEVVKEEVVNDCGHPCFIIGGPFISEDPTCPVHGDNRTKNSDTIKDRLAALEKRVAKLEAQLAKASWRA
jgi:hypothetical protein